MKIQELSVGDWVATPDGNIGYIVGLSTYTAAGCAAEVIEKGESTTSKWECLQLHPIPLTPKILKKNGWYNDKVDPNFFATDEVYIYNHNGVWRLRPKSTELLIVVDIKHVHELQHALRLLGVEKEIEL